jgi:hypothetical protein
MRQNSSKRRATRIVLVCSYWVPRADPNLATILTELVSHSSVEDALDGRRGRVNSVRSRRHRVDRDYTPVIRSAETPRRRYPRAVPGLVQSYADVILHVLGTGSRVDVHAHWPVHFAETGFSSGRSSEQILGTVANIASREARKAGLRDFSADW